MENSDTVCLFISIICFIFVAKEISMEGKERKEVVVKIGNTLPQSRFKYTQAEMDLLFYLMFIIRKDQCLYRFTVKEIEEFVGKEVKGGRIRESFRALGGKVYETARGDDDWEMFWIFRRVSVKEGMIEVQVNEEVIPLLCDARSCYTSLELIGALKMGSKYSKRLYMLLCSWKGKGGRTFGIGELKDILQYPGGRHTGTFTRIVNDAVAEINSDTDLEVTLKWEKLGRSFAAAKFVVKRKRNTPEEASFDDSIELFGMKKLLCAAGISPLQVEEIHSAGCSLERAKEIYGHADSSLRRRDVAVEDPAAYLLRCFEKEGFVRRREEDKSAKITFYRGLVAAGTDIRDLRPLLRKEGISEKDVLQQEK